MKVPAYPAAREVAAQAEARFSSHVSAALREGLEDVAPPPDAFTIEALVDTAFWASLRREEGISPRISLALLPPERAPRPLIFEQPLRLVPSALVKLGPAVERPGIHLGVWRDGDALCVWGATRSIPSLCFVLEVVEPGLLVIKYRRAADFGKFGNVAVLRGDEVKLVDEHGASLPDCPDLLGHLSPFNRPDSWSDAGNVLVQLAVSMRAHGRGGALLVVPEGSDGWRRSVVQPVPYSVAPPFTRLARLVQDGAGEGDPLAWQEEVRRAVDGVAGVTAVDGATVITTGFELLAFGAKITRPEGSAPVERVTLTEPVVGNAALVTAPATIGGTRHLSAAQFVQDQRDSMALVASQDGRFTVFAWSPCEDMVHGHRVEALLL